MMRKRYVVFAATALGLAAFAFVLTNPDPLPPGVTDGLIGDPVAGEVVFHAAGCASCHMAPGAEGDAQLVLAGGQPFATSFGTFYAPNISPDPVHGIGGWTLTDLADAMKRGVSPEGRHYYPAFPYTSYARADLQDIADLKAYLDALPASQTDSLAHDVGFPFNIRRSLGGWKLLFFRDDWVIREADTDAEIRGRYLVEALGHCGECHTPRNVLGGAELSRWLAGGPDPSDPTGKASFPNITPAELTWSESELVAYFTTGFTPDFDSAGGHMAYVIENLSKLPESDRAAIAAYLKKVPPNE